MSYTRAPGALGVNRENEEPIEPPSQKKMGDPHSLGVSESVKWKWQLSATRIVRE